MGIIALLTSMGWTLWKNPMVPPEKEKELRETVFSRTKQEAPVDSLKEAISFEWKAPENQSGGNEWIFEIFTPPLVYYHEEENRFTVKPPFEREQFPAGGIELLSIKHPLYRLQYRGHTGGDGWYLIEVEDIEKGTWFRGKVGQRCLESAFVIEDFEVAQTFVSSAVPEDTPYVDYEVALKIWDERLKQTVLLTKEASYSDQWVSEVKLNEGSVITVRVGSVLKGDASAFEVINIDQASLEIEVVEGPIKGKREMIYLSVKTIEKERK